jgi:uncharacterized protein YecE (DUF72 family)
MTPKSGQIRIGIGGWTFAPWRGVFYPKGLAHARELAYASQRLTSIEVNGTFYRSQTPATFRKWAGEVPAGFVFALKGPRFAVNRRVLKDAGDSIQRFLHSGVTELGCATSSRSVMTVFATPNSSRSCAASPSQWCSPTTSNIPISPT